MSGEDTGMLGTARIKEGVFQSAGMLAIRIALGVTFIVHGIPKFGPGFADFLESQSLPVAMHYPIALGEFLPGVLLIAGVLSRISGAVLALLLFGILIVIDGLFEGATLTGEAGVEWQLILFAAALVCMVVGPGRASLAQLIGSKVKTFPRWLH
ncbi:MAG: DoxX family protein [Nitrosopumilus sp.]|nr:DoxX family protein [Nitrosopumilus sp.]